MRAIRFTGQGVARLLDMEDPTPGVGEVVVEVRASGLCHTDFEVLSGNYGTSAFPVIPGHEFAGLVVETGPGVGDLAVGDRVVIDPNLECGHCRACRKGWAHLCETLGAYGVTTDGGFAERCVLRAGACHKIPDDMDFSTAALAEPMGCILNGIEAAGSKGAERVLIAGAGAMGILMALALRHFGAGQIALADLDESRLAQVEALGFQAVAAGGAAPLGPPRGFDVCVDATGVPSVVEGLLDLVADGGCLHVFGVCPQDARIAVSPFALFRRQLRIAGSHSLNHNIPQAVACLRAIGAPLARVVSHRVSLAEMAQVFEGGPPSGATKVQVVAA